MVGPAGKAEHNESGSKPSSLVASKPDPAREAGRNDIDQLIGRARNGDSEAVAELYRRHVTIVLGYLRANGCTNPDDATADVFEGMLKSIHRFTGDADDFRRWLMTIAHRRLIDDRRRRGRRRSNETSRDAVAVADRDPASVRLPDTADALVVDIELVEAVSDLTDDQRQVIGLRFIADLSIEEVAAVTGRSVTGVKALQRRALAALRRSLSRAEPARRPDPRSSRPLSWIRRR